MNCAQKREWALISAGFAALAARSRSKLWTAVWTASASALYLSSRRHAFSFKGKTVSITGGSRGLGLSLAWNILQQGGAVVLAARDFVELSRAEAILRSDFPEAVIELSICDVTNSEQLRESFETAIKNCGRIDVLVNNAGSILVGPFNSMKQEDFEAQMNLHTYAVIEATKLIMPHFRIHGEGRILNICSFGGKAAVPHMLPYDTSKFALAGFSEGVTAELAAENVKVTTAYPSVMRTGSYIQAVFKGDHEREFEWFASLDNMPGISTSADAAAKQILTAVCEERTQLVLSVPARARMLLAALLPEIMNSIMAWVAQRLPAGNSELRKTGGQSTGLYDKNKYLKSLRDKGIEAENTFNQVDTRDPERNMGLH